MYVNKEALFDYTFVPVPPATETFKQDSGLIYARLLIESDAIGLRRNRFPVVLFGLIRCSGCVSNGRGFIKITETPIIIDRS